MSKIKYVPVYHKKAQGVTLPKLGTPDRIRPGDYLTFFIDGAYHTRVVDTTHSGYVMTCPLISPWGKGKTVLDKARKVPWDDIDSAARAPATTSTMEPVQAPPEPELPKPLPEPKVRQKQQPETPRPKPAPAKPEKPPKVSAKEILDLWALLDDK